MNVLVQWQRTLSMWWSWENKRTRSLEAHETHLYVHKHTPTFHTAHYTHASTLWNAHTVFIIDNIVKGVFRCIFWSWKLHLRKEALKICSYSHSRSLTDWVMKKKGERRKFDADNVQSQDEWQHGRLVLLLTMWMKRISKAPGNVTDGLQGENHPFPGALSLERDTALWLFLSVKSLTVTLSRKQQSKYQWAFSLY